MSTYGEIRTHVLAYGFNSPRYSDDVGRWINEGQNHIAKNSNLRTQNTSSTITTSVGDSTYTVPANFSRIIDISYAAEQDVLEEIPNQIAYDELPFNNGRPTLYIIIGDQITFYPTPDGVYSISLKYWKLPAELTADGQISEIPADYHYLLEQFALSRAYRRENDYQAATYWRGEFDRDFSHMKFEVNRATDSQPSQVPGTWSNF